MKHEIIARPRRESLTHLCFELGQCVYFIRTDDDLIKIGCTGNLARRKADLVGAGRWDQLLAVMPGGFDDERELHQRFARHLERGREYFRPAPDLVQHINEIRVRYGVEPVEI